MQRNQVRSWEGYNSSSVRKSIRRHERKRIRKVNCKKGSMSNKNSLNLADIKTWIEETLVFSSPAILAFLIALRGGMNWQMALGAGYSALLTAAINLLIKYKSGN